MFSWNSNMKKGAKPWTKRGSVDVEIQRELEVASTYLQIFHRWTFDGNMKSS
jgi:hypothetical protein